MALQDMDKGLTKTINNAPTSTTKSVNEPKAAGMTAPVNSYEGYLNDIYSAQKKANLDALDSQYTAAIGELERQKAAIPVSFNEARRQTAGTNAQERRGMNEVFTAQGLSSGAKAQGNIAQSNALQRDLSALQLAEAQALADLESQRTQTGDQYRALVREAIMNNEMQKAAALYDEAIRYDNALTQAAKESAAAEKERAAMLAGIGDFSGYAALGFTPEQIASFESAYAAASRPTGTGTPRTDPAHTDYYKTLNDLGVTDAGYAYQILLGLGLSDAEATKVSANYVSGLSPEPAGAQLKTQNMQDLYDSWKSGKTSTENVVRVLDTYTRAGQQDDDDVNWILTQMGL